jgi:hypothetical protein
MSVILDPTAGVTFPDSVTQATAVPDPSTAGNGLVSNGAIWQSQTIPSDIASGTAMLFKQTAAPTGWTKDTVSNNNSSFRVVTGAASTGGSVDFSAAFVSQTVAGTVGSYGSFTLTTTELPAHTHTLQAGNASPPGGYLGGANAIDRGTQTTSSTGGGGGHSHTGGTFTGTAINLAVKYVDFIVATKN